MISLILDDIGIPLSQLGALTAHDGWGMAPVTRFSRRGAQQHGDTDIGYILNPRYGTLVFRVQETTLEAMYAQRDKLLQYFAPDNDMSLLWTMPNGTKRQIDVVYSGDLSLPWEAGDWAAQELTITLKANDPTFYDPAVQAVNFSLTASGAWAIPWAIPWPIGDSSFDEAADIAYTGKFISYPVIRIIGPITSPIITNETTGDKLDFTGASIGSGDAYIVDCRYGHKTVVDNAGADQLILGKLSNASDLDTFCLAAPRQGVASRVNTIRVQGSGGSSLSNVILSYYRRYLGV